jgi:hypothetical protein
MTLIDRAFNAVSAFTKNQKVENSARRDAADFLRYGNREVMHLDTSTAEITDQDMYSGYSYAAIEKRANRTSALGKSFLYTEASKTVMDAAKKKNEPLEHPYLKLIRKSKEFSRRKFWHDISTYLDLEGVYYLMAVRSIGQPREDGTPRVGEIQKFVMLNPYHITRVVRQSDGEVGGYVEARNGLYREIPKEMIIEMRLLNPIDNDKAYSMTDAAKEPQFVMKQANEYTRHSIKGNIKAPGILSTSVELEDQIFDNFVSRVQNHEKGGPLYGNGSGAIDWQDMQIDLDKAALDKINEIQRSVLFSVLGVSDMLMGQQKAGTGREVSKTQKEEFTENAIMPRVEDILDALNLDYRRYYPEWEKNEYEILLDNPLETDREAELKDIEIRETELNLRESLVNMGYEYDLANKYAHGDISLEELGEPTLEPELTEDEADRIAARELGMEAPAGADDEPENLDATDADDDTTMQIENRVLATNKFVAKEQNEKKLKEARKRMKAKKKADADAVKEAKKKESQKAVEESQKVVKEEKDKEKATKKDDSPVVKVEVSAKNEVEEKVVNQVASRDFDGLYDGLIIDQRAVTDDDYRGCIMIDTEKIPVAQYVKNADKDLFENPKWEQGPIPAETKPHATLLYGLLNNGNIWKDKVDLVLKDWKMDTVRIEEVSYFDTEDSYAVIGLLEVTDELLDANQRLSLLPHLNTFSEYHPHITLAYVKKDADVDKWVKSLGKKYNGQIVSTKSINYGDLPEDDESKTENHIDDEHNMENLPKATKIVKKKIGQQVRVLSIEELPFGGPHGNQDSAANATEAPHSHDCDEHEFVPNATLIKATNALEPAVRDDVLLQQANLQSAVAGLERSIVQKVLEYLREGDIESAEELIAEQEQQSFVVELAAILAAYYYVMFPIYAAQLFANRLRIFNSQGIFAMTDGVTAYIDEASKKAAESHVRTVLRDISNAINEAKEDATREELAKIIQERIEARDPAYTSKLPDNPNVEHVTAAVNEGIFDKDPAYQLARERTLQGASLVKIQQSLQDAYNHISQTRAKTIARHEASRVFNMSQYQADLQFLAETNNLDKAYKRLRSRTGDPCAVCNLLIEKTREKPIPFAANFADLGTELTASYKKENGKVAVQKVPVNYEAITAGNVHVNCNCEYELLIDRGDGTFQNSIDVRTNDELEYTENDFDPNQPRDDDGKWTDGGVDPETGMGKVNLKTKKESKVLDYGYGKDEFEIREDIFATYGDVEYTTDEDGAIHNYTGSGYQLINELLRHGKPEDDDNEFEEEEESIEYLKKAARKTKLKTDTILYRGSGFDEEILVGSTIRDKGFSSTSLRPEVAEEFTSSDHNADKEFKYVMRIKAPKGTNGIFPATAEVSSTENEFILPPNAGFKVVKISEPEDESEFRTMEVELVYEKE